MSIFEDKKHNGLAYVGQKPVHVRMAPGTSQDDKDATYGLINHGVMQDASVRNIPNKDK